jgi:hypothetical protein
MTLNIATIVSIVLGKCGNLLPLFFGGILVCSLFLIAAFYFYGDYKDYRDYKGTARLLLLILGLVLLIC